VTDAPPAIRVVGAGKRYVKYEDQPMLLTAALRLRTRTRRSRLWALRDASFEVGRGECVGVIGRNGSGKSTMLQMLAGVTAPTEGTVAVWGRVAPLVAIGVGFHPELTGRENVFVNATILGLRREQIEERFEDILAFSEIPEFIDTPVKFYSSGMYIRLGFSVAIHSDPDVLLVDEVLAVGDLAFQFKCFDRMLKIRDSGATLVIVSHNLAAIRRLCDRTLLLDSGRVLFDGPSEEAISRYHEVLGESRELDGTVLPGEARSIRGITVESLEILDRGTATRHFESGDEVTVRADVRFEVDADQPLFHVAVMAENGLRVYGETAPEHLRGCWRAGDRARFEVAMRLNLATGTYTLNVGVGDRDLVTLLAWSKPVMFWVSGREAVNGVADLAATIRVIDLQGAQPKSDLTA